MELQRPSKDRSAVPTDYMSMEDLEKDIQNLRSFASKFRSSQDFGAKAVVPRKVMLNGKRVPRPPQYQDGLRYASEEGDVSLNFAKAERRIKGINDELLRDYATEVHFPKSDAFLDNQKVKDSTGTKRHPYVRLPNDEVVLDYSEQFPETKATLEYNRQFSSDGPAANDPRQLPDHKGALGHPEQVPTYGMSSRFQGQLTDDKTAPDSAGQFLDSTDVSGHQPKMSDAAATIQAAGQVAQMNRDALPHVVNSVARVNKTREYSGENDADFIPKHQSNSSVVPSFEKNQIKDDSADLLHQIQLELDDLKKHAEGNGLMDETLPKSGKEIWSQVNAYPATLEQEGAENFRSQNNKPNEASHIISQNIDVEHKNKNNSNVSASSKKITAWSDLLEKTESANQKTVNFSEKIREMVGNKNQDVRDSNTAKTNSTVDNASKNSAAGKQKAVKIVRNKTDRKYQTDTAAVDDNGKVSDDGMDVVKVEKRKGNMAGKYAYKPKPKTHHRPPPNPQPPHKPPAPKITSTTTETTLPTTHNTTGTTAKFMQEIIDGGSDDVNIPLSGTPSWTARIHGRRDVVLAGAIMGGIGLLLIMLSLVYVFINRRSSEKKPSKNGGDKAYHKLGSTDEKVGLTGPKHNLFPLSSDEITTEESGDETQYSQGKTNNAVNY